MPSNRTFQSRDRQFRVFGRFKTTRCGNALRSHNRPQPDIFRAYTVAVILMPALAALEVQALAVGCRDVTTAGTTPRSVFGIDLLKADSRSRALVGNKELPLCIRPTVNLASQVFPLTQRPVPDIAEVLNGNRSCSIGDRVSNQLFRGSMEQRFCYGCLMATHASEKTPRAFGANRLDGHTFASNAGAAMVFHPAFKKECSVVSRVCSYQESLDPEVHTNNTALGLGFGNINLVGEDQIPLFTSTFELGILPPGFRDSRMIQDNRLPEYRDALPVLQEVAAEGQRQRGALVNSEVPLAGRLHRLVAGRHLPEEGAGKLGRQLKLLADDGVESTRQTIGVQLLRREDLFGYPASSRKIPDADRIQVRNVLNLDLDCANCFQYSQAFQIVLNMSTTKLTQTKDGLKAVVSTQLF